MQTFMPSLQYDSRYTSGATNPRMHSVIDRLQSLDSQLNSYRSRSEEEILMELRDITNRMNHTYIERQPTLFKMEHAIAEVEAELHEMRAASHASRNIQNDAQMVRTLSNVNAIIQREHDDLQDMERRMHQALEFRLEALDESDADDEERLTRSARLRDHKYSTAHMNQAVIELRLRLRQDKVDDEKWARNMQDKVDKTIGKARAAVDELKTRNEARETRMKQAMAEFQQGAALALQTEVAERDEVEGLIASLIENVSMRVRRASSII
ncbi:Chromosome partition protein Smc [Carpediemonas membranifera]|uniref:Chromosome partition protein Smc n=1 Tax=Carpediemonas membranifera TaxID=201153 RepID=A0A8J6E3E5_9EUKA|nr:Chromosome partition protein Smc [Carpediemonas membranifera]|eukprot:KAG9393052.1 Chromosome partition protein Smc [Carpediemonas membranifera]